MNQNLWVQEEWIPFFQEIVNVVVDQDLREDLFFQVMAGDQAEVT